MGRLVNNVQGRFWGFFRSLFRINGDFDCGTVSLAHGKWVLYFDTADRPANVWFNVKETFSLPVCGGSTSVLGASMDHRGFYLFADIRSSECVINWFTSEY